MASSIIETDPQTGIDQPVSVIRNNFVRTKIEIEELQNGKLDKSGGILTGVLQLSTVLVADLPNPALALGGVVLVLDSAGANPVIPAYSDGVNWLEFDGVTVIV